MPCDTDDEPKVKKLHFLKETQLLPTLLPVDFIEFVFFELMVALGEEGLLIDHVLLGGFVHILPRQSQAQDGHHQNHEVDG